MTVAAQPAECHRRSPIAETVRSGRGGEEVYGQPWYATVNRSAHAITPWLRRLAGAQSRLSPPHRERPTVSRTRPPTRRKAPPPVGRRHRTPVKVQVGPRVPWWVWGAVTAALVAVLVFVAAQAMNNNGSPDAAVNAPQLASVDTAATGATVAGIQCGSHEETLFHIHAHVAIMVDGSLRSIPQGIGIAPPRQEEQTSSGPDVVSGSCFYWLHTHTADGIIHIESPLQRTFTLGDFFDMWGQPLSSTQAGATERAGAVRLLR